MSSEQRAALTHCVATGTKYLVLSTHCVATGTKYLSLSSHCVATGTIEFLSGQSTNDCCCAKLLGAQPDFAAECSALQHLVETRIHIEGMLVAHHMCFFLPKFHCELNWIERKWGASKAYTRKHCLYTLAGLRETVPLSLSQDRSDLPTYLADDEELPVAPIYLQRRWARISRQFMAEYRKGADGSDAIKAVKAQRSTRHRDPNDARSKQVESAMAALSNNM